MTEDHKMRNGNKFGDWLSTNIVFLRFLITVLWPLVILPLPLIIQTKEAWCSYVILVVAIFWTTEALPLAITALLPAVLFPLTGVVTSKEIVPNYMKEVVLVQTAGFMVAVSIEKWNIHKRLAIKILLMIGCSVPRLMLGFMVTGMALSMWISNTATTTMMIPIVEAVLVQIKKHLVDYDQYKTCKKVALTEQETSLTEEMTEVDLEQNTQKKSIGTISPQHYSNIRRAMQLCLAYSTGFGGTATIIGTGPIILTKGFTDVTFNAKGLESPITFGNWMLFSVPISVVSLVISWVYLQVFWFGVRFTLKSFCSKKSKTESEGENKIHEVLQEDYEQLGPMTWAEKAVSLHFAMLAVLWTTRDLGGVGGWSYLFKPKYVGASAPAVFIVILLFIFPSKNPFDRTTGPFSERFVPLLDIHTFLHKTPWHIMLLLGGGMTLSYASQKSGLSDWFGVAIVGPKVIPPWLLVAIICLLLSFLTEFTSNVAVTAIMLPILAEMAVNINMNPLFLMIPGGVACTFAFMLPAATPPNAIVYSHGDITILEMARCGVWVNLMSVVITTVFILTWGVLVYDYMHLPEGWYQTTVSGHNITLTLTNLTTTFTP